MRAAGEKAAPEELDDEDYEAAWRAVREKREEIAHLNCEDNQFLLIIRGGRWTRAHKGVAADYAVAMERKGMASHFCSAYGLPKMRSFWFLTVR